MRSRSYPKCFRLGVKRSSGQYRIPSGGSVYFVRFVRFFGLFNGLVQIGTFRMPFGYQLSLWRILPDRRREQEAKDVINVVVLIYDNTPGIEHRVRAGTGGIFNLYGFADMPKQVSFTIIDKDQAVFRQSADKNPAVAQNALGQMYEDGEGVIQNYASAAKWYRKAAEHVPDLGGAGQGRNHLGLLYLDGHGVPKDYVQAYMWFILAGESNPNLPIAKDHMTSEQILEAERLVAEWKSRYAISKTS